MKSATTATVVKILDARGEQAFTVKKGNEFWLEKVLNGPHAHYDLKFERGKMDPMWEGTRLYPLGIKPPPHHQKLPEWDDTSLPVKDAYRLAASDLVTIGSADVIERLEGRVASSSEPEVVRIYIVRQAITNGKDWLVLEVKTANGGTKQDGTAHGDPNN